ncbi:MspA family porin [Nocardia sp. NPDC051052]|uniref:MspA family porin n=1 Tax=Nocardia sp. NPDC051052 TaxID=3364322 RepID=UPI00379CEF83
MRIASALATAASIAGIGLAAAPFASAGLMAPHEKTYNGPEGVEFTVGHTDEAFNPIAPQNGMPANREVFLDDTFYGRVDPRSTGTLKAGYLVACAVDVTAGIELGATAGLDASIKVGVSGDGDSSSPSASASIGPSFHVGAGIKLAIAPGEIKDIPAGTKDIAPGHTGYLISRDFHVLVKNCGGPLTIVSYSIIEAKSAAVTGTQAVYGDPIFL